MAIEYANNNGLELLSMPIHPFSKVADQKVSNNRRYTEFLDRYADHELAQSVTFELKYLGREIKDIPELKHLIK